MAGNKTLGAIAAIGSGLMGGYMKAGEMAAQAEDRQWTREQRDRQRKQWSAEDQLAADAKAATETFNGVLSERRKAAEEQWKTSGAGKALSASIDYGNGQSADYGGDAASAQSDLILAKKAGAAPGADPAAAAPAMKTLETTIPRGEGEKFAWQPAPRDILDAHDARTQKLFELGRNEEAWKDWQRGEAERAKLRQTEIQKGILDYKTTGDPTAFFKNTYGLINDGKTVTDVRPAPPSPTGQKAWQVVRRDDRTGKDEPMTVTEAQIGELATWANDPKAVAEYTLKAQLEKIQADEKIRAAKVEAQVKGEEARGTERVRHEGDMEEIRARTRGALTVEGARTSGDIRVAREKDRLDNESGGKKANSEYLKTLQQERISVDSEVKSKQAQVKSYRDAGYLNAADKAALAAAESELATAQQRQRELTDDIRKARQHSDPNRPSLKSLDGAPTPTNRPSLSTFEKH